MLLSYDWLKELVDIPLAAKETADLLTLLGLEVEAQEEIWQSPVFDIKVTPQRGDCLCAIGVARELAAALQAPLRRPVPTLKEGGAPADAAAGVTIKDADLCPRYSARVIRNVKVGLSPGWVRQRLEQCGVRPINNIVDITNLVMLLCGQPLHAFDAALLRPLPGEDKPAIIVRRAQAAEELVTLDGERRALFSEMLVIADGERAVALAGVMGGANSEVHEGTTTVLLESAHFAPAGIRRTARALGMNSEASFRFERRVDPGGTVFALDVAAAMMAEFAGGEIAPGVLDAYPSPVPAAQITLRAARANALLGTDLSVAEMRAYLARLEIPAEIDGENLQITSPSHRGDLHIEEDVIEEIARMHGYDKIPSRQVATGTSGGKMGAGLDIETRARRTLLACGLDESLNYSLEGAADMARAGFGEDHPLSAAVLVKNPKVEEYSRMRTSMLPTMLNLLSHNWRRGARAARLFEVGKVYWPRAGEALADERRRAAVALMTGPRPAGWGKETIDFYAVKGIVEELLDALGLKAADFGPLEDHPTLAPGRAAAAFMGETQVALLGQVREDVLENYDLPKETYLAEVNLEEIMAARPAPPTYQEISRFPAAERDLALLVPVDCPAQKVEEALRAQAGELLESLELFDLYEGKSLPEGTRSLAYSLVWRAPDRTLTDEEIEKIIAQIEAALKALGVTIRRA